uniref:Putative ovule protein n=1 Tax=Solanum chacoense TaxID=4108 RepID=A0A0V0HLE3_SOLCH
MRWNQRKITCPNADSILRHHIMIWYRMAKHLLRKEKFKLGMTFCDITGQTKLINTCIGDESRSYSNWIGI